MADRWQTYRTTFEGGLMLNQDALTLGDKAPGAAVVHINYEPSLLGGYRRINGYQKYDDALVPGVGPVMGLAMYDGMAIASRARVGSTHIDFYKGSGAGWTKINLTERVWTGVTRVRSHAYNWFEPVIVFVDGVNRAARWNGFSWQEIAGIGAPLNPSIVTTFANRLVLSGYSANPSAVSVGVANSDLIMNPSGGAFEFSVGDTVVGLRTFRETLYIFCQNSIHKLIGTSINNFELLPVTRNIGCVGGDTIQEVGGDLLFLAPDGIRPVTATERIGDVELSTISREVWPYAVELIRSKSPSRFCSCVIRSKNQYRLFATDSTDEPDLAPGILGGIRNGQDGLKWEWSQLKGFHVSCADTGYSEENEITVHGGFDGYVYRHDSGSDRDGAKLYSQHKTPFLNFTDSTVRKTLYKIDLYYRIEGATDLNLATIIDYQSVGSLQPLSINIGSGGLGIAIYGAPSMVYGAFVYGVTNIPVAQENLIGSGFTFAFDIVTDDNNPPHIIQAYTIEYGISGRR